MLLIVLNGAMLEIYCLLGNNLNSRPSEMFQKRQKEEIDAYVMDFSW